MENNALIHHGILGQKWGVRRYQNEDGTLTEKGKLRYRKSEEQKKSEAQKKQDVKERGTFTNAQLKEKIERLKLEKELRELTKSEVSGAQKFIEDVLKDVGKKTLTNALSGAALYGTKAAITKEFDRKEFANAIFNGGPKKS